MRRESDTVAIAARKCVLEDGEQATRARERRGHGPELSEKLMPLGDGDAFPSGWERVEELIESSQSMWRESECPLDCVELPAEDRLASRPERIPLTQFFGRYGLFSTRSIVRGERAKDLVDRVEAARRTRRRWRWVCAARIKSST